MTIRHLNPSGLFQLDAFTQVVTVSGGRLAFIAGQGAFDRDFRLVGAGDLHAQTVQAFRNLAIALEAAGSSPEQVVSATFYVVGMTPASVEVFARAMAVALDGRPFPPTASSMIGVQSLAMEGMLVEISAVARIPE